MSELPEDRVALRFVQRPGPKPATLEDVSDDLAMLQTFVLQGLDELQAIRKQLSEERVERLDKEVVGHG